MNIIFLNAGAHDAADPHGYLVFNMQDGTIIIADDYEVSNDHTARDFVLRKEDALDLAIALLDYVKDGATSACSSITSADVEDRLRD